jgi:hypothetical protein
MDNKLNRLSLVGNEYQKKETSSSKFQLCPLHRKPSLSNSLRPIRFAGSYCRGEFVEQQLSFCIHFGAHTE